MTAGELEAPRPSACAELSHARRALRGPVIALALVVLVNLALGGFIATSHEDNFADTLFNYEAADNLYHGKGLSWDYKYDLRNPVTQAPFPVGDRFLYPVFIWLFFKLFGVSLHVANFTTAFFRALTIIPLFLLGDKLFGRRAAWLGVGLYSLNPFYLSLGVSGYPDSTGTFFYYSALLALVLYALRPRWPTALAAGALLSLSFLTREEGGLLGLLGLGVIAMFGQRRGRDLVALCLSPALALALRSVWLAYAFGDPLYNAKPMLLLPNWPLFYLLDTFTLNEYLAYVGGWREAIGIRLLNWSSYLKGFLSDGFILDMNADPVFPLLLLLPAAWAFRGLPQPRRRLLALLVGYSALAFLITMGMPGHRDTVETRHGHLPAPLLLVMAAGGLAAWLWPHDEAARPPWRPWLGRAGLAYYLAFAGVFLAPVVQHYVFDPPYRGPTVLAAEWAAEHTPPGAALMSRKPAETHLFSQRPVIVTPSAPFVDLMRYAQRHAVRYYLVTDLEHRGTPNLLQGMAVHAAHFRKRLSAPGYEVWEALDYSFLDQPQLLPNELYAKKTDRLDKPFRWRDVWRIKRDGAVNDALDVWRAWLSRAVAAVQGRQPAEPGPETRRLSDARLGDDTRLLGYRLQHTWVYPGGEVEVDLRWQAVGRVDRDYTVFVHIVGPDGSLATQKDAPPLEGQRPTTAWQVGEEVVDRHTVPIPDDLPPGSYCIAVGMYSPATGERRVVTDAQGSQPPDRALVLDLPLEVRPR